MEYIVILFPARLISATDFGGTNAKIGRIFPNWNLAQIGAE
jgi:hypothetical protein